MPVIRASSQGESRVRVLRIMRRGDRHDARDLSVACRFEGGFGAAFREGRSDGLVPGETLKNIVYGVARDRGGDDIEAFGLALCERLLSEHAQLTRVRVEVDERRWARLEAGGRPQGQAFTGGSAERRTAAVTSNGAQTAVVSGIEELALMRTSGLVDGGQRADDGGATDGIQRLLVATLSARWTYTSPDVTFASYRQGVRATIVDTFSWHASRSVQHTLYNIADVVLASYQEIADITLALRERPYRPADLFSAGLDNPDELFVALDEPLGVVEVTVERG